MTGTSITLRAFAPTGWPIVATVDWTPSTPEIDRRSWAITEEGRLFWAYSVEGPSEPDYDGVTVETLGGYRLFVDDRGQEWPEEVLHLLAVDAGGNLLAAEIDRAKAVAFEPTPSVRARSGLLIDRGLITEAQALVAAAEAVVATWERGDLAGAVCALSAQAEVLRALIGDGPEEGAP